MNRLTQVLKDLRPQIEEVLKLSGTVGLSYGVLLHGEVLHQESFGHRDLEKSLLVDEHTVFPLCSLSKAIVASGLGILIDQKESCLSWETLIHDILPDFSTRSDELKKSATLLDYLSMRTGMQSHNVWLQSQNNVIFPASDGMKILNSFRQFQSLRQGFQYDNWAYEIAGRVVERISGQSWGAFLSEHIFKPLDMTTTVTRQDEIKTDNTARAYTTFDDGTPHRIRGVQIADQNLMGAAGGISSCVTDILKFYQAYLLAHHRQSSTDQDNSSLLRQVRSLTTGYTTIALPNNLTQSYCMGWAKGKLPSPVGIISNNFANLGEHAPVLGRFGPDMVFWNHAGSMAGAMTSALLFPESQTAIVVLTNTLGLTDSADTITQMLAEAIFEMPERHDFVQITKNIRAVELQTMNNVAKKLEQDRNPGTKPRRLEEYFGRYLNETGVMIVDVFMRDEKLTMRFQDMEEESYDLNHYEDDTFIWWMPRNECVRRGRFTNYTPDHFKIAFAASDKSIDQLLWKNCPQLKDPEVFHKLADGAKTSNL